MGDQDAWKNLPIELVQLIAQRVESVDDVRSFSCVCKSWKVAVFELEPWMHSKYPCLLLAEDPGFDISEAKVSMLDVMDSETNNPVPVRCPKEDGFISGIYQLFRNTSSIRGWFSLATQKIYNLDLPQAMDKLLLGTNNGWLVTLGRDFETNLLHPLSRRQIQLPPVLKILPCLRDSYAEFQERHSMFIRKVVMSSEIPRECALQHQHGSHLPIIMAIYTKDGILGFTRLGDKFWTNVELEAFVYGFEDIVYHKNKFYAIDFLGTIFMCDIDDNNKEERQHKAKKITSIPFEMDQTVTSYLVESLSGSHIWLVLRFSEGEIYKKNQPYKYGELFYHTIHFKVFKLEIHHSSCSSDGIPTCVWTEEVQDLGNETLFIGKSSSLSVVPSKFIHSNCIYFTDDSEYVSCVGGGHDAGIFDVKTGKIEPQFRGKFIHPFSPSLWCI